MLYGVGHTQKKDKRMTEGGKTCNSHYILRRIGAFLGDYYVSTIVRIATESSLLEMRIISVF